jgi:hypothetical protein
MSGYIGNDGSALSGGLNPSGVIAGLNLDAGGNLKTVASGSPAETPVNFNQVNGAAFSNTNPLFVDLVRVLGAALSAANPVFVSQSLGGAVLSATNPEPNISNIQQLIMNGQGFSATTGKVAAAANMAAQFWVPSSSTKNVLIWSARTAYANANQSGQLTLLSAQDANITGAGNTNDSANFANLKAGGSAAASGATLIHNGGIAATSGTPLDFFGTSLSQGVELLSPGMFILIPAGVAAGLGIYEATTAAGSWSATLRWCEY